MPGAEPRRQLAGGGYGKSSTVGGPSRTSIRLVPPDKEERDPLADAPPRVTDTKRYRPGKTPKSYLRIMDSRKPPAGGQSGAGTQRKTGGQSFRDRSNDAGANRLPSLRLRRIIAPARLRRIGLCDVGVSQGDFAWRAPEMVALPRTVRGLSDAQLFHPHRKAARGRTLLAVQRAEARPGISKKGRIDSRRSSPPYGQATGEGVQVPGTPLKHKDNRKR